MLISMKLKPKSKRELMKPPSFEGSSFPYGLNIRLEKEALDKLDMDLNDYDVEDYVRFNCRAQIKSISSSDEMQGEGSKCISLQIVDMEKPDSKTKLSEVRK